MVSKRTLTRWRKEALRVKAQKLANEPESKLSEIILKLTQELLDQQLLKDWR